MRRRHWILIGTAVLVLAAVVFLRGRKGSAAEFRVEAVGTGDIVVRVSATGSVKPVTQVEIGSQVSGTVQAVYADFNDRVKEGDLLLQIDPATFRAQLSQARANEMKAEVGVDDALRALRRAGEMRERGLLSEESLESAQSLHKQAQATLEQAKASRDLAEANLRYATIRAPLSGLVVSRNIDVGQTVAASLQAPKLFVIANDLTEMQVETRIDEADIGRIREGMEATFSVDAYPDESFAGRIEQVRFEPIEEQNVITYTTIIRVQNPDLKLKPGMTANVTVVVDHADSVLKVPNAALRFRPKGAEADRAPGGARAQAAGSRPDTPARASGAAGPGAAPGRAVPAEPEPKISTVYLLENGGPAPRRVRTGLTDGSFTAVYPVDGSLREGDSVITGIASAAPASTSLPPGMMGGPRPGGRR